MKTDTILINDLFQAIKEYCIPLRGDDWEPTESDRWGHEVYWVSSGNQSHIEPLDPKKILRVIAYVTEGNESPLITVGWIVHQKRYGATMPLYAVATIKVFCDTDTAYQIAKDLQNFVEGFIYG